MGTLSCLRNQNKITDTGRYRAKKFSSKNKSVLISTKRIKCTLRVLDGFPCVRCSSQCFFIPYCVTKVIEKAGKKRFVSYSPFSAPYMAAPLFSLLVDTVL